MKLVSKFELMRMPSGTIFREFWPMVWKGEWCRFYEPCSESDFIYAEIGPELLSPGQNPERDCFHAAIMSDMTSRTDEYDNCPQYIVLEHADVKAMIAQLLGEPFVEPPVLKIEF